MKALRINERYFALTFLTILVIFIMVFYAEAYTVGVEVGKWAKYSIDFKYVWDSDTEPEPQYLLETQKVEWNNVTVIEVVDSNVTITVVTHFINYTEITSIYQGNIINGVGNLSFKIIAAGIQQGQPIVINPDVTDIPLINKTEWRNYAGASREVNFLYEEFGDVAGGVFYGNGTTYHYYWDKETGFLCELGMVVNEVTSSHKMKSWLKVIMVETNLWEAEKSNILGWLWLGIIIVFLVVSLWFLRSRKKKPRRVLRSSRHISRIYFWRKERSDQTILKFLSS
jgi:hypothetical protein